MAIREELIYKVASLEKENGNLRQNLSIAVSYVRVFGGAKNHKTMLDKFSKYDK